MSLDRNTFLSRAVVRAEPVETPIGTMLCRGLTGTQSIELMTLKTEARYGDFGLLVYGCVNTDGEPIFTIDDLQAIAGMPIEYTWPLLKKVKELSGMGSAVPN